MRTITISAENISRHKQGEFIEIENVSFLCKDVSLMCVNLLEEITLTVKETGEIINGIITTRSIEMKDNKTIIKIEFTVCDALFIPIAKHIKDPPFIFCEAKFKNQDYPEYVKEIKLPDWDNEGAK